MEGKYFKPMSLTWWAAVVPGLAGVFLAMEPLHGLTQWVAVVNSMTGNASPPVLINAALFGIGLRGAM